MLSRLALRIAVCEALAPTNAAAFPTIARHRVYDTRVDSIDGLSEIDAAPMVIVYTEEHGSAPYGRARAPADDQIVTLTLELILAVRGEIDVAMDDGTTQTVGAVDTPVTDPAREAMLDLLEAEVRRALDPREMRPGWNALRHVLWEMREASSIPLRDVDRTTRLAQRSLQIKAKIPNDDWPAPGEARGDGLDALPEPLRGVAKSLPAHSPHLTICTLIAGRLGAPTTLPQPGGVTLIAGVDKDVPPTAATADITIVSEP